MLKLLIFTVLILASSAQELVVELQDGKVQGITIGTPSGRSFYGWKSIPYAKPPLGELRFKPPVRPDPWTDILDGSKDSPACRYVGFFDGDPVPINGYNEDCLYINVYSPIKPNSNASLPVMFWIYGGGFFTGTGDFSYADPSAFMQEDVIIVTFNYRLSVFGFLSTEDEVVPGNSALKDQNLALIWTRENIAFFGGNPLDITIFGESAGAMSVGYHLVSPMSRNLFTGAILQSGSSIKNFLQTDSRNNALKVAQKINSSLTESSASEEILSVLQAVDADVLVNLTLKPAYVDTDFRAVIEVDNPTPFLTQPFYEAFESGDFNQVPIIIGTNSEERINSVSDIESAQSIAAYYDQIPSLLLPEFHLKKGVNQDDVTQEIKRAYVGNGSFVDDVGSIIRWMSDDAFVRPSIKHAVLQSKYTPVYFYMFSFVGTRCETHLVLPGCGRVAHADDVPYFFNISTKPLSSDADFLARRRLVKLWTNFAKTKNPTPNDDSAELLQNVSWTPFDETNLKYLDIGENLEVKDKREAELTVFWDHLWESYSYRPYTTF